MKCYILQYIILELSKQNNFEESVSTYITLFLIYKIWKVEYWYSVISNLTFSSKEMRIAKNLIYIANLEYNMILMLIHLFKLYLNII